MFKRNRAESKKVDFPPLEVNYASACEISQIDLFAN